VNGSPVLASVVQSISIMTSQAKQTHSAFKQTTIPNDRFSRSNKCLSPEQALAALNEELRARTVPLRASADTFFSGGDGRIRFQHDDGIRVVVCEAEAGRLYIVHQHFGVGGERIGEQAEDGLRDAYRAAWCRWQSRPERMSSSASFGGSYACNAALPRRASLADR
jgi:hypothetical protein